jgi:DNA topoisomerase IA
MPRGRAGRGVLLKPEGLYPTRPASGGSKPAKLKAIAAALKTCDQVILDQIFNLSLTRTATKMLVAYGAKGVIGIGRVKTPTLAIVCMRELEIRNFRVEDYFEIVATAQVAGGSFTVRHAPPPKQRIKDRSLAEAIARAAANHTGPLGVTVEHRRQGPPRLFDLPSLQKACGQRWGWTRRCGSPHEELRNSPSNWRTTCSPSPIR